MLPSSSSASPTMATCRPGGQVARGRSRAAARSPAPGAEAGQRHAEADGAGGEIHLRPVLHPARIGLDAAELAQRLQLLPLLPAEQVVHGVEHRPGMRLHRHPVLRPQDLEVERRHDGDDGGAGGLVPAHLQPVPVRAGCGWRGGSSRPRARAACAPARAAGAAALLPRFRPAAAAAGRSAVWPGPVSTFMAFSPRCSGACGPSAPPPARASTWALRSRRSGPEDARRTSRELPGRLGRRRVAPVRRGRGRAYGGGHCRHHGSRIDAPPVILANPAKDRAQGGAVGMGGAVMAAIAPRRAVDLVPLAERPHFRAVGQQHRPVPCGHHHDEGRGADAKRRARMDVERGALRLPEQHPAGFHLRRRRSGRRCGPRCRSGAVGCGWCRARRQGGRGQRRKNRNPRR